MNTDFIRDYWETQAKTHQASSDASWGDKYMIGLEVGLISSFVFGAQWVLDAGCANGHATLRQAETFPDVSFHGIDFSSSMIAEAKRSAAKSKVHNVTFEEGDIRKIEIPDSSYDLIYTTRVLINLPSWEQQKQGINECLRVTKPGGKAVFLEAFWEPLMRINAIRSLLGMGVLTEHDFNRYLKESAVSDFLEDTQWTYELIDFSSVYYFGSRVFREFVGVSNTPSGYNNAVNELFFKLQNDFSAEGLGVQKALVITKGP